MDWQVTVERVGEDRFAVTIRGEGVTTRHQVVVPAGVGVPGVSDEELVRESIRFLLEREPPTAILSAFDLPVIARYFPEYPDEIRRRLGG